MAGFYIGSINLGETVFGVPDTDKYVLATNQLMAEQILIQQRYPVTKVNKVCMLNRANNVVHRQGATVYITHGGKVYEADTVLVLGVPSGVDTTRPCKVYYKR